MTEFDKTHSFFHINDEVGEPSDGLVQIEYIRPEKHSSSSLSYLQIEEQFAVHPGNIPELIEVLQDYLESVPTDEDVSKKEIAPDTLEERVSRIEEKLDMNIYVSAGYEG